MATIQGMPRARLLVINNDAGAPYISLLQSVLPRSARPVLAQAERRVSGLFAEKEGPIRRSALGKGCGVGAKGGRGSVTVAVAPLNASRIEIA